jgi:hypothetical protein
MRTISSIVAVTVGLVLSSVPARAHHSFGAEFDSNQPVTLVGVVSKVEWINPHAWISIDVKSLDGTLETWRIEAGSPNILLRRGFSKNTLEVGTEIKVRGFKAKDGAYKANGGEMTLPNGQTLLLGSAGTGAPPTPSDEPRR